MRTEISIPNDVFEKAEQLARHEKKSRSELFSEALREYVARHSPDEVTEAMNSALDAIGGQTDPFVSSAAKRVLERSEW